MTDIFSVHIIWDFCAVRDFSFSLASRFSSWLTLTEMRRRRLPKRSFSYENLSLISSSQELRRSFFIWAENESFLFSRNTSRLVTFQTLAQSHTAKHWPYLLNLLLYLQVARNARSFYSSRVRLLSHLRRRTTPIYYRYAYKEILIRFYQKEKKCFNFNFESVLKISRLDGGDKRKILRAFLSLVNLILYTKTLSHWTCHFGCYLMWF